MLTSSVVADTEERGYMWVCLTHIYLLTQPFSALTIGWSQCAGRCFLDLESKVETEANKQTFIQQIAQENTNGME